MADYEKQTWVDNTTPVDAEHLNHIEDGIAANAEDIAAVNADLTDNYAFFKGQLTADDDMDKLFENGFYYFNTGDVPANSPYTNGAMVEVTKIPSAASNNACFQRVTRWASNDQYTAIRTCYNGTWHPWYTEGYIENGTAVGDSSTPVYVNANGRITACSFTYLDLVNLAADAAVAKVNGTEMPDMSILEAKPVEEDIEQSGE